MEQINKVLETVSNKLQVISSKPQEQGLLPDEKSIIEAKYTGKRFDQMSYEEITDASFELLVKIHIISGWNFPIEKEFQAVLTQQFRYKLLESYSACTSAELEYAFRTATTVKDWGKDINLMLIDEVMRPYFHKRMEISKKEEKMKSPNQKIYTDKEITNQRRGEIELAFQAMKKGNIPIIHIYFSEILIEDGLMNKDEKIENFLVHALATRQNLYTNE
jgi:hypothetical protein